MSYLLQLFANNLLPIFLVAGSGYLLARWRQIDPKSLSNLIFYLFAPCLLFNLILHSKLETDIILRMSIFTLGSLSLAVLAAWLICRILKFNRKITTLILMAALLPNAGNFGLATVKFAFGEDTLTYASLYFMISTIVLYTGGVFLASMGTSTLRQALVGLLKAPVIYAVALGMLIASMRWGIPMPIDRAIVLAGDATIPAMLVLLGLQIAANGKETGAASSCPGQSTHRMIACLKPITVACVTRLVIAPLIGFGLAYVLSLKGAPAQAAITESATPVAVMVTVLATEYDIEPSLASMMVLFSTLLSPLTLTPILAWLGG
ncbi:MAG: AEC family transporter [Chloroflexota bacterium]